MDGGEVVIDVAPPCGECGLKSKGGIVAISTVGVAPPCGECGLKYSGDTRGLTAAVGSLPLAGSVD